MGNKAWSVVAIVLCMGICCTWSISRHSHRDDLWSVEKTFVPRLHYGVVFKKANKMRLNSHVFLSALIIKDPPSPHPDKINFSLNCAKLTKQKEDFNFKHDICTLFQRPLKNLNIALDRRALDLTNLIRDAKILNKNMYKPDRLTESNNRRTKRNIFGSIFSSLFGLATKQHIHRLSHLVQKHLDNLNQGLSKSSKIISGMTSALEVTHKNLESITGTVNNHSYWISVNTENIHNLKWQLEKDSGMIALNAFSLRFGLNLTNLILSEGLRLDMLLNELMVSWTEYRDGLIAAKNGRLHAGIISPRDLVAYLDTTDRHVRLEYSGFMLQKKDPAWYYRDNIVYIMPNTQRLILVLRLDIVRENCEIFQILQILSFEMPIQNDQRQNDHIGYTYIPRLPAYIGISKLGRTFEMTKGRFDDCKPTDELEEIRCHSRLVIHERSHLSCPKAILNNDHKNIIKICNPQVLPKNYSPKQAVIDIDAGHIVIAGLKDEELMMTCDQRHTSIKVYHLMVMKLSCFCELISKNVYIPENNLACERFSYLDSNYSVYPTNMLALSELSNRFEVKDINISWETEYSVVNLSIKPHNIFRNLTIKDSQLPIDLSTLASNLITNGQEHDLTDFEKINDTDDIDWMTVTLYCIIAAVGLI